MILSEEFQDRIALDADYNGYEHGVPAEFTQGTRLRTDDRKVNKNMMNEDKVTPLRPTRAELDFYQDAEGRIYIWVGMWIRGLEHPLPPNCTRKGQHGRCPREEDINIVGSELPQAKRVVACLDQHNSAKSEFKNHLYVLVDPDQGLCKRLSGTSKEVFFFRFFNGVIDASSSRDQRLSSANAKCKKAILDMMGGQALTPAQKRSLVGSQPRRKRRKRLDSDDDDDFVPESEEEELNITIGEDDDEIVMLRSRKHSVKGSPKVPAAASRAQDVQDEVSTLR